MKRQSILCAALMMGAACATAQNAVYYDFQDLTVLDLDEEMSPVHGSITGVSPNGKYAVGSDNELTYHSWIWQAEGTAATTHEKPAYNLVLDINDEGTAVGTFYDPATDMVVPGYRTADGTWVRLEQPAYAQTANQGWRNAQYNDAALAYVPLASFISRDGKHIGGWTYAAGGSDDSRPGFDAKLHGFFWHQNAEGGYTLEDFTDMDLSTTQQGFRPYAMNEEGTIMVGLAQREDNGLSQPAAIIDGRLVIIIEAADGDFSDAAERGTDEGSCFCVSGRNIYGYATYTKLDENDVFDEATSELYSFRYNADTGKLDRLPGLCVKVSNENGECLAIDPLDHSLHIVESDFQTTRPVECPVTVGEINSASEDFSVLGGFTQQLTDVGILNTPIVIKYDQPLAGVQQLSAARPAAARIYDLQGRPVAAGQLTRVAITEGKKTIR